MVGSSRNSTSGEQQPGGQVEAAAHPAGVLLDRFLPRLRQAHPLQQFRRPLPRPARAEVVEPAEHLQVLPPAQHRVDRGVLADQPDAVADPRGVPDNVETRHAHTAGVGPQQGGEDAHTGGLARAVR
ncbi:hypothetical protein HNR02_005446 [Amycolatopsis endophytica]|uniref:Uncharacterized protein n=1 Tax=Amycolatopsis endophytica TaxID=860233 RepID=A0A853BBL9_9PSEU|nr:hypothetical protein [Amycolatopsis endophytica]